MAESIRNRALFVPQQHFEKLQSDETPINNFILKAETEDENWIQRTTERIGDWKNLSRSIYLRWAITINSMEIAANHYRKLPKERALETLALRSIHGSAEYVPLAVWSGEDASEHYKSSLELVAAYGVTDLVGAIEDIVFDAFELFLLQNPDRFIRGPENKELRKKFRKRDEAPEAWATAITDRISNWRRKRIYDGLHQVVRDYWRDANLKRPSGYIHTDVDDWCNTIKMFSELRNLIVHGANTASKELEDLSNIKTRMSYKFKEGEILDVKLHHLQSVECFLDQYLCALNISLLEKARGPVKEWGSKKG